MTKEESYIEFAYTALLTNEMIVDKRVCPIHHGFWVRKMEEEIIGIEHA